MARCRHMAHRGLGSGIAVGPVQSGPITSLTSPQNLFAVRLTPARGKRGRMRARACVSFENEILIVLVQNAAPGAKTARGRFHFVLPRGSSKILPNELMGLRKFSMPQALTAPRQLTAFDGP